MAFKLSFTTTSKSDVSLFLMKPPMVFRLIGLIIFCYGFNFAHAGSNFWTSNGPNLPSIQALAIAPTNASIVYAGTDRGFYKSTNGGLIWNYRLNPSPTPLTGKSVQAIAVDPTNALVVYAGVSGEGLYKSLNGGVDWTLMSNGLTNDFVSAIMIDPTLPTRIYAGTGGGGVFKSNNGAGAWSPVNTGLADPVVISLALDPDAPATLYAGTTFGVYKTASGGGSWTFRSAGLPGTLVKAIVIAPGAPKTIYIGTDGSGVFSSVDGAAHWSEVNNGLTAPIFVNTLAVDPIDSRIVYAGLIAGGIYKTTTSGNTWFQVNNEVTDGQDIATLAVHPKHPKRFMQQFQEKVLPKPCRAVDAGAQSIPGWRISAVFLLTDGNWQSIQINPKRFTPVLGTAVSIKVPMAD